MSENNKTSKIWTLSKDELQNIINTSASKRDILKKIDINLIHGGNYITLDKRIEHDKFDMTVLKENYNKKSKTRICKKINIEDILKENSSYSRNSLKLRLVKDKLLEYKCVTCGNDGMWRGQPLGLQLDHINGISNDHRLVNLRFLCPSCHSQTETYGGKNHRKLRI